MTKILVVVDMQKDFIDGSLGSAEANAIVPAVVDRIKQAKADGWEVVFTLDTHDENYLSTREGRDLPVVHCIKGTEGWQLNDKIAKLSDGCRLFEKGTFASRKLMGYFTEQSPEEVEFVGVCTDICVVSNAICARTILPETPISVTASCCAGVTPESHEAALKTMQSCHIKIK
jgi:nicotinamidase-related amidase